MITQVRTPRQRQRFRSACRGKLCLGVTMPQALALFGKSQPGRFFAGQRWRWDVGGSTAWLAGHANPDELASFLHFCGCKAVILDEAECPPPTGWAVQSPILSLAWHPESSCRNPLWKKRSGPPCF